MDITKDLLDISWKNITEIRNRFQNTDTKVAAIITICGVLTSLLNGLTKSGVANTNLNTTMMVSFSSEITNIIFTFTAISLLITIIVCLYVIRPRNMLVELSTIKIYENINIRNASEEDVDSLIKSIGQIEDIWRGKSDQKTRDFGWTLRLLAFSIILLLLGIIFSISNNF